MHICPKERSEVKEEPVSPPRNHHDIHVKVSIELWRHPKVTNHNNCWIKIKWEFNWEEMEVRQSADGRFHLWWVVGRIRIDPALCWCPVSYSSTLPTFPHDHRQTNICTGWPRWPLDNEWVHRQSPICWINDGHDDDFRDPHYQTLPPPGCHLSLIPRKTLTTHLNFAFLRNC